MSEIKIQHYLPKVYLNNFSFNSNGDLYRLKIKSPFPHISVEIKNKSAVCFQPYFYKLNSDESLKRAGLTDPFYIEKNLFKYERTFLSKMTNKIDNYKNINNNDAINLIEMLLSLKQRNIVMKKIFSNKNLLQNLINKEITKLKNSIWTFKLKYGEKQFDRFFNILENMAHSTINDPEKVSDLFNESLYNFINGTYSHYDWLIKELSKSVFFVFTTTEDYPFITSDNPGFTVHEADKIHNTLIANANAFAFPLSPRSLFIVTPDVQEKYTPIIKKIEYRLAKSEFVDLTNRATILNCDESIFSNQKDVLENIKNKRQSYFTENQSSI